jgi:hypothetical protein
MSVKVTDFPELNRRAFAILTKEMGVPETLRFFGQLGLGTGNYTEERRRLFADLTLDEYRKTLTDLSATPAPEPPRNQS